jgi:hypothetical protein
MSRVLPRRASLEHLRNQAKQRLHSLQQQRPDAKLSDAQHLVAREYGFASWPKLKAHVAALPQSGDESAPSAAQPAAPASRGGDGGGHGGDATSSGADQPSSDSGFTRYSHKAKEAVFFSRFEAASAGRPTIEGEELLMGLLRAAQGTRLAARLRLSLDDVRQAISRERTAATPLEGVIHIPFDTAARRMLRHAVDEADRLGHQDIRIVHLLLGILCEPASPAAAIVARHGVRPGTLRREARDPLSEEPA